ncbi:hypothetical protein [Agrilutibacter solisilvae]|uniref:hypothetical protein n=1 Tax=Agrilutibacter solisilvae TaxID=2763317 RepID=UPI001FD708F7|nr:hypothetical protein [Lysobacter solisilvae]
MRRTVIAAAVSLVVVSGSAWAQSAGACGALNQRALPVQPTMLAPLAPELTAPTHQLGAPTGVLAQAVDEALAVDNVLLRLKVEACLASTMPAPSPGLPSSTDPAAYKPKTAFDNTPWRFDMSQNGKRMTADEFTAWMKAKGVRVAKGAGGTPVAAPAPVTPPVTPPTTPPAAGTTPKK